MEYIISEYINDYIYIFKYISISFLIIFTIQTFSRLICISKKYRPSYVIYYIGTLFQILYYYIGLSIGYTCIFLYDTMMELIYSFKPYFMIYSLYDGIIYVISSKWSIKSNKLINKVDDNKVDDQVKYDDKISEDVTKYVYDKLLSDNARKILSS